MKIVSALFALTLGSMVSILAEADSQDVQLIQGDLVELSIKKNESTIALSCMPKTEAAGENADWVIECNRLAYQYLISQTEKNIELNRQITEKPFGMAADFMAKALMSDPSNFKAIQIGMDFEFINKND